MSRFAIILPTTGDRGALLRLSVGSVQQQSETDWALYIVGDGVHDDTREVARDIAAADPRVHFVDHPKHPSRGEEYRHALLSGLDAEIVCYLCDRDLMLPNHLALMARMLEGSDFAHTLVVKPSPAGVFVDKGTLDVRNPGHRLAVVEGHASLPLSLVGHRLDAYRRLPYGWRTTPERYATDWYMWQQFLAQADIRATACLVPSIVYLRRGRHPGLSTRQRLVELERYAARFCRPAGEIDYADAINRQRVEAAGDRHIARRRSPLRRLYALWARVKGEWQPDRMPKVT